MAVSLKAPTSLLPVKGVRIATAAAGVRYQNRNDLVLFELSDGSQTAAVFTKNKFCAAPVLLSKQHLSVSQPKFLLINSGNANAGTGEQGLIDAKTSCTTLAQTCGCKEEEVLPFSTGVIGARLPVEKMIQHFSSMNGDLNEDAWLDAANAIMTTDTVCKGVSKQMNLDGHEITITGIAKGAGMIRPDMATMLAFVATDLKIELDELHKILTRAVDQSFHCITVDGDTSTNDACVLVATGKSEISLAELTQPARDKFIANLNTLFIDLAQAIIRDGEGASKFITIQVEQAKSEASAREIAFTIAHSPLVKTAAFASDPNWGRILAAIGRADVKGLEMQKLCLYINQLEVVENGELAASYNEEFACKEMQQEEILFRVLLGMGDKASRVWTTDLSYEYVKINAEYRT